MARNGGGGEAAAAATAFRHYAFFPAAHKRPCPTLPTGSGAAGKGEGGRREEEGREGASPCRSCPSFATGPRMRESPHMTDLSIPAGQCDDMGGKGVSQPAVKCRALSSIVCCRSIVEWGCMGRDHRGPNIRDGCRIDAGPRPIAAGRRPMAAGRRVYVVTRGRGQSADAVAVVTPGLDGPPQPPPPPRGGGRRWGFGGARALRPWLTHIEGRDKVIKMLDLCERKVPEQYGAVNLRKWGGGTAREWWVSKGSACRGWWSSQESQGEINSSLY